MQDKTQFKTTSGISPHWHQKAQSELLTICFSKLQMYFTGVFSTPNSINIVNEGCNIFLGADLEFFCRNNHMLRFMKIRLMNIYTHKLFFDLLT